MILLGGFIGTLIGYTIAYLAIRKERQDIIRLFLINKLLAEDVALAVDDLKEALDADRKRD